MKKQEKREKSGIIPMCAGRRERGDKAAKFKLHSRPSATCFKLPVEALGTRMLPCTCAYRLSLGLANPSNRS